MSVILFLYHYYLMIACALALLLLLWIRYIFTQQQLFVQLGIPGPRPSFLFGNALDFANKFPLDVFNKWNHEFGAVFGFYEGLRPSVVICCPDLAYKVLVKHFNQFSTRPVINPFMHEHEDLSLQNVSGHLWKRQRQAVSAGMSSKSIREMFHIISAVTDQLVLVFSQIAVSNNAGFFIDDIIERYSLDWFSQAALGYHSDALTNDKNLLLLYMRASHESMSPENAITGVAKLFPWLASVLKPLDWQHKRLSSMETREVTQFVRSLKSDMTKLAGISCNSIIYNLMTRKVSSVSAAHKDQIEICDGFTDRIKKTQLDESEVVGEVSGLVGGGVGPFSSALTFCLYCLAVYPEEQDRLRRELENITNAQSGISVDDLSKLHFMERFIRETLRCYPVAPGVSRECVEDCVLDGVHFRKGMVVRVMFSCMYHQEKHFKNPDLFIPDRFQNENDKDDSPDDLPHLTPFMPFGVGPRMCVGRRLALVVLKLALVRIVKNFVIDRSDITQIPLQVTLRPFLVSRDGVHVRMRKICQ